MKYNNKEVAARIRLVMKESGMHQSDLAQTLGVTQGTISNLVRGATFRSSLLPMVADALAVNLGWLTGSTRHRINMLDEDSELIGEAALAEKLAAAESEVNPIAANEKYAERLDTVPIKQIDLNFGMGATYLDVPVVEYQHYFPKAWVRQYTRAKPDDLMFAHGVGDSMAPTIQDSDLLLIDCSQQRLVGGDKLWAIAFGETGMVKRLRQMPDGSVKILSDNPLVPPEIAVDGEMTVLGRVVAKVSKM